MLMVSGVGPAETLRQFNIPIIADLPGVGQNMWDHILFGANYRVSTLTHSATSNATFLAEILEEYMTKNGSGMLGNPGGDLIAFEKLPSSERGSLSPETLAVLAEFPPDWPEIEYLALDAYSGNNSNYITGAPKTPYMYVSASAAIVAPSSRGNVTITSASMEDPPLINPNWLTHPADQELAVAAFRRIRQLMDTDIVSEVVVGEELLPGRHVMSDSEILYSIRENGIQVFHAAATCEPHSLIFEIFHANFAYTYLRQNGQF
jgi:choline dehydrogenase